MAPALALMLILTTSAVALAGGTVTIGYQTFPAPYEVGIENNSIQYECGWTISFRRFNSGAEIFAAMAGGSIDIGDAGSSPIAAAASNGLDLRLFYISSVSGEDEALVVREGTGIESAADLGGRRLAAAPVSTDHYQLLAVLAQEGIPESAVHLFTIPQAEIVAGWKRGYIDAAFVWDPALTELTRTGKVLLTSRQVAARGAPTFNAFVSTAKFADKNPDFLKAFVRAVDRFSASFKHHPEEWGPQSDYARSLARLQGGTAAQQVERLRGFNAVDLADQAGPWLGGGEASGAARVLKSTSEFLVRQHKIGSALPSYGKFVVKDSVAAAVQGAEK